MAWAAIVVIGNGQGPTTAPTISPKRVPAYECLASATSPTDECTDDTHDDVAEKAEAAALHDLASEPPGDGANRQPDNKSRGVHFGAQFCKKFG